jgi:uncharacterized protein YlxW (UPF0749 family)
MPGTPDRPGTPDTPDTPDTPVTPGAAPTVARRPAFLRGSRITRAHVLAAVLLGLLGFSLVVQARQTQSNALETLDQSQLVQILDNVNSQSDRLDIEARELQQTQAELRTGSDRAAAAERAARSRLQVLGVLAGTIPASGPGIRLTITDFGQQVSAAMLLDTVQELRDAGAEAIQLGQVRVVASTALVDAGAGRVRVDGVVLTPPYTFLAIGDPQTMSAALDIPGGVLETLHQSGAAGTVRTIDRLTISATRQVTVPRHAVPDPAG